MLRTASTTVLKVFSSIWLGVTLLTLLFIYCSVGSSGVPVHPNIFNPASWVALREMRAFELTEFEWFHWWPFDLLISLICINLTVATLRRIPLNMINLGVWMIHAGIITLSLGSVYYFSTKVEGDTPVLRRQVVIQTPDGTRTTMPALPGSQQVLNTSTGQYAFRITSIDPSWELLSGDDQGQRAFSVNLMIQSPTQQFIRQMIAGYPQYTEDLIRTDDPAQPFQRAVKVTGKPLVDESLAADLVYHAQTVFYLMQSRAIYLRELGSDRWIMRPIEDLPRFNDHIASHDQVWITGSDRDVSGMPTIPLSPIDYAVPAVDPDDPLPDVDLHVTGYLRYAFEESRREPGGGMLDPVVKLRLDSVNGESFPFELAAFDPSTRTAANGLIHFLWADTPAAKQAMQEVKDSVLHILVPEANVEFEAAITETTAANPDLPFTPIEGTEFSYRVNAVENGLNISGMTVSLARIEIKTPEETFQRWVFDEATMTRDLRGEELMPAHDGPKQLDERIETHYHPGRRPAGVTVIAGPGEQELGVLLALQGQPVAFHPVQVGQPLSLGGTEFSLTVSSFDSRTTMIRKPAVVPLIQRDRDVGSNASMIQLRVPDASQVHTEWLGFHQYAFDTPGDVLRRFPYQPKTIILADGRRIELLFARQRMDLPAPVALDDFIVDTHIGGFTGSTSSIRDWTSMVSFQAEGGWTSPEKVHMNAPGEYEGFWFFQSQWDPPAPPRFQGDVGSAGFNYTVLGVGNRNGVIIQLTGCCISVFGMIWAFYIKPILKRRRQQAVYAAVGAENVVDSNPGAEIVAEREPISVGSEEQV